MTTALALFHSIISDLEENHKHLQRGYMLSGPALEYKGRAFVFYRDGEIVVKLGSVDPASVGIRAYRPFRPFYTGISLSKWIQIPYYYYSSWTMVAELALLQMRDEIG